MAKYIWGRGRGALTSVSPGLKTIVHIIVIFILLHAHDDKVSQIAVHLHFLLLQHRVFCCFCVTRKYNTRCSRFDGTAGHLGFWLC